MQSEVSVDASPGIPSVGGVPDPQVNADGSSRPADVATKLEVFRPVFSPRSCYLLRDADEVAAFAASGGAPEATLIAWATSLIAPYQTFIDVGAHVGTWAQHFATTCRSVHAFEPQQSTYDRLREGVRLAKLGDVVTCHNTALGARGEVDLHVVSGDGGGSTLRPREELPSVLGVERVRAKQLDDYDFEEVGLIKIDVEGCEMDVLRGAIKTLEEHRPKLLLEAWTEDWYACDRTELISYVERLGYRVEPVPDRPEMLLAEPVAPETAVDFKKLLADVERALPEGGDWCDLEKASRLAALVVSFRPKIIVELGVWRGGTAVPMAIALRHLGFGKIIAVDAWAAETSVAGQEGANAVWWGDVAHEPAYKTFVSRLKKHGLRPHCVVRRQRTDEAAVPEVIDILHHDANHGPQVVVDVERWAPAVRIGGLLILNDLGWEGGHVQRAMAHAVTLGFVELYRLGTGSVMQRVSATGSAAIAVTISANVVARRDLMAEIEVAVPDGGSWCSVEKATALATILMDLRPKVVVELGVWQGGSAIPMAITLRYLGAGQLVAVDAWSAAASVQGQEEADSKWWGETISDDGHERAYQTFLGRLRKHGISDDRCTVVRRHTDEADVPPCIDVLHHDANHGPQAVRDIERWAPAVRIGGLLVIDDIDWPGGHVRTARSRALELGFVELYTRHQGPEYRPYCVLQRVANGG